MEQHDRESIDRARRVVAKAEAYETLRTSPEFQQWKAEQIDARLQALLESAMRSDQLTPAGRDTAMVNIIAYQELRRASEDIFTLHEKTAGMARGQLDKLL